MLQRPVETAAKSGHWLMSSSYVFNSVNARAASFAIASTLRATATARTFREADQGLFKRFQIRAPAGGHGPE